MKKSIGTPAIVYCQSAFNTPNGKTAHGLVRFTERFKVLSVIDATYAGKEAGEVLDNRSNGIPIVKDLEEAMGKAIHAGITPEYFIIGLAPDGGRLSSEAREEVYKAINRKMNIVCGLHDFLSEDRELAEAAAKNNIQLLDIRKPPHRKELHFFSGDIEKVDALKIAFLGTDSAVGKRTSAWILVHELRRRGFKAEMVGTGQTAWMQGAKYSLVLDSLVNDFVAGELEHATVSAWKDGAEIIIIEGQGSLMNPAYPGGHEILAACRPDMVVMQHAPARKEYDGFPGYPMHPLSDQIAAVKILSGKPVVAVTVNHENLTSDEIQPACDDIRQEVGIPAFDVLVEGGSGLCDEILKYWKR
ncbi:MAG: DUF1611 domain-containing protein [Saprospiraceae bacterium]|nr:DUF1611 domain-containing protein [Saprospiraceae bacterium]